MNIWPHYISGYVANKAYETSRGNMGSLATFR